MSFNLFEPDHQSVPLVFSSPHSGADYPAWFLKQIALDTHTIRSSEDAFVDSLFSAAPSIGAPMLTARVPRAIIDLNRSELELDPAVVHGVAHAGTNPRITSGLGVVPRVVAGGRVIYRGKLTYVSAQHRITTYWRPYHQTLTALLDRTTAQFGQAILIDCHSMPRDALEHCGGQSHKPDIVIGDRFGSSASRDIVEMVEAALSAQGFTVARNTPFSGAYITQRYGRPSREHHAIQLEIDRSLYMDEATIRPHAGYAQTRRRLTRALATLVSHFGGAQALAAE